jgi:hypothetical protein
MQLFLSLSLQGVDLCLTEGLGLSISYTLQCGGPIQEKPIIRTQSWERNVSTSMDRVSPLLIPQQSWERNVSTSMDRVSPLLIPQQRLLYAF